MTVNIFGIFGKKLRVVFANEVWSAASHEHYLRDLCRMRLPNNIYARLQDAQEQQFDRNIAARLAILYPTFAARAEPLRLEWVSNRRRWLARIGVTAQQHVLDHLEIMVIHGNGVIDDPVYRAIMARPFRSQEEKAVRLRQHFLIPDTAKVSHE